ncbi:MAG: tRNA (adenosine(37)-N6)-threonylcarbamoyltransferase complex ATPase subunit type 1 TsaE [Candidatus Kryptoniota bacterium]
MEIFISNSEAETIKLGKEFAKRLQAGNLVALYGDLGAGKTQFVKGVCEAFEVKEIVNSPTFTIVNEYHGTMPVFHIDLYRMKSVDEIFGIGFDEYLESGGICLVEWAEKLDGILPARRYDVKMSVVNETTREITAGFINGEG